MYVGTGDCVREVRVYVEAPEGLERLAAARPLVEPAADVRAATRPALEDGQVQIDRRLERQGLQLCVPAERVREVVGPTPDQPAIEAPLPGGRSVDPVVQIERAA